MARRGRSGGWVKPATRRQQEGARKPPPRRAANNTGRYAGTGAETRQWARRAVQAPNRPAGEVEAGVTTWRR